MSRAEDDEDNLDSWNLSKKNAKFKKIFDSDSDEKDEEDDAKEKNVDYTKSKESFLDLLNLRNKLINLNNKNSLKRNDQKLAHNKNGAQESVRRSRRLK